MPATVMRVSGLSGRAGVANGTYRVVPGEQQHRRPVYVQERQPLSGPSRLIYDKTPGEPPAWMIELPDQSGKAYAYCEDRAKSPADVREIWQVWHCGLAAPIERGVWRPDPSFQVVAVERHQEPEQRTIQQAPPSAVDSRPVPTVQAPASIEIRRHPYAEYNGQYADAGEYQGYPHYSNAAGKHLFRPVGLDLEQWLLSSEFRPRANMCESYIECADATPPLGVRRWAVWCAGPQRWEEYELELIEDPVARLGSSARQRQQIQEFARSIGIDSVAEPHLMWIAESGFRAALPPGWREDVDRVTGETIYIENMGGGAPRQHRRHPRASTYEDMAQRHRTASGSGFNRTNSSIPTDMGAAGGDIPLNAGIAAGHRDEGHGDEDADAALARSLSLQSQVEDDVRREERRRLAAEDAIAMGFESELVQTVQGQGNYDTVDGLVEKLAELTCSHTNPEPERQDDFAADDAAAYDSACALGLNFAGLPNPSNYCFLNATVQCLRHTPGFANMLSCALGDKTGSRFSRRPVTLLEAFVLLLRRMEDGQRRPVRANTREWENFIAQCKEQLPSEPDEYGKLTTLVHLKRQPQQDAGEFLLQLLDQLSQDRVGGDAKNRLVLERRQSIPIMQLSPQYGDEMGARLTRAKSSPEAERRLLEEYIEKQWRATKDTTRRTLLGAMFQGQELTYKLCRNPRCGLFSPASADPVLVEELHCSQLARRDRATLDELLRSSSEPETPEDFACDKCKSRGTTAMARVLVKLPKVLVIRLNRALPDDRRVDCSIDFPEELDISERLLQFDGASSGRMCVGYSGRQCQPTYRLFAAVFHEGRSVRSGHYIAYVRSARTESATHPHNGGSTGLVDTWVCCDDDQVIDRDTAGTHRAIATSTSLASCEVENFLLCGKSVPA